MADQDGRGHAEAEHEGRQQEHDHVGVGRRGERALAEETADPDGVDGAVQRLEDRGGERWQREGEQGLGDRPFGEVAAAADPSFRSCVSHYPIPAAPMPHEGEMLRYPCQCSRLEPSELPPV